MTLYFFKIDLDINGIDAIMELTLFDFQVIIQYLTCLGGF
jgi:hypothetical protein